MGNYGSYLKPFLLLLNYCPETVGYIQGKVIRTSDIVMDQKIVNKLRKIDEQTK